jgi:hypothetical protein
VGDLLDACEREAVRDLRDRQPVYVSGARLPRRFRRPAPRPVGNGPRLRYAPALPRRVDTSRFHARLESHRRTTTGHGSPAGTISYLRATYAADGQPRTPGSESLLGSRHMAEAARTGLDRPIVHPILLYANLYLPGQELDAHTDIPAFRGATQREVPPWLLVAMRHSGLFERWRIEVATVVWFPSAGSGGSFTWYPSAPGAPATVTVEPSPNTAVVLDADTVFHRVDRVAGEPVGLDAVARGAYLVPSGGDRWRLRRDDSLDVMDPVTTEVASWGPGQLRYSLSWKAYCFPDAAAEQRWRTGADDLPLDRILPTLLEDLRRRGRADGIGTGPGTGTDEAAVAARIIDEFIPFPDPAL